MTEDKNLPKQELLLKMLKMTTSDNDGTALVAIRKANSLLEQFGWDWDKLIAGKIRIVENPFSKIATPGSGPGVASRPAPSAPPPPPQPKARPAMPSFSPGVGRRWEFNQTRWDWDNRPDPNYVAPKPAAAQARSAFKGLGLHKTNMYANHCYCCGVWVANNAGFIIQPTDFNKQAKTPSKSGWAVCCDPCNNTRSPDAWDVPNRPAMKQTGQTTATGPAPSLNNL